MSGVALPASADNWPNWRGPRFDGSAGGTGYGDPLDREPESVAIDLDKGTITPETALRIYKVIWDPAQRRIDVEATAAARQAEFAARKQRGRPYDAFEQEWSRLKPPEAILEHYGTWPDARPNRVLMRA